MLRATDERYAALAEYTDRGTIMTRLAGHPPPREPDATFTTAFRRPATFAFRYQRDDSRRDPGGSLEFKADCEVVRENGRLAARCVSQFALHGQLITTDHLDGARPATLGATLLECGQMTDSASVLIPRLLMPADVPGRPITDLDDLTDTPHAAHGSGPDGCRRFSGTQGTFLVTLWIDPETALIRRIARSQRAGESVVRIDYQTM